MRRVGPVGPKGWPPSALPGVAESVGGPCFDGYYSYSTCLPLNSTFPKLSPGGPGQNEQQESSDIPRRAHLSTRVQDSNEKGGGGGPKCQPPSAPPGVAKNVGGALF